ncbi:3-keto-5-aminohexanoate cleavage protein [Kribbella sp. NPDC058245]|uniref:3-keto-5-aminohexanoate cleavage protein n=1 Tax=Kribbella sp. NPDC058245 TaxID=3346399 RepID=UPI0036EB8E18
MIKACLNGDRTRADHPGVPITPDELAHAAAAAVPAGTRPGDALSTVQPLRRAPRG